MFRSNRFLYPFAVCLLAACEGDLGPAGPTGTQGPQGPAGSTATYTAGAGISISGNVISTALSSDDGDGPNSGSNLLHWNRLTGVPGGLADGTDDGPPLADGSVTNAKLAPDAVTSGKIANGTVAAADLAPGAVTLATTFVTGDTWIMDPGDRFGGSQNCPTGIAIGGGWTVSSPTDRGIHVQQSYQQSPTSWVLTFVNTGATTNTVTAYVLCLTIAP